VYPYFCRSSNFFNRYKKVESVEKIRVGSGIGKNSSRDPDERVRKASFPDPQLFLVVLRIQIRMVPLHFGKLDPDPHKSGETESESGSASN
jgi:hypothetical protein